MKKIKPTELVVVRVWAGNPQDVFALFPEVTADNSGDYCLSYQQAGQHGIADYSHCIKQSRPATQEEAAPLLKELRLIGYNPLVIQRASPKMHNTRRESA